MHFLRVDCLPVSAKKIEGWTITAGAFISTARSGSVSAGFLATAWPMQVVVALGAGRDQILQGIVAHPTARLDVVHLKLGDAPAKLAAPPIALQHLPAQPSIGFRVKSQSRASWAKWHHEAFRTCSRNSCCLGCGKNPKSRPSEISKASGFPFSRLAPARKSAQIISRQ